MQKKQPLYAGFAKINISPKEPQGMTLMGMPRLYPGARGILDQLHARAVYLESGDKKHLMICADIVLVAHEPPLHKTVTVIYQHEKVINALSKWSGLNKKDIWLVATHCHSSAGEELDSASNFSRKVFERYLEMLREKLIKVGKEAIGNKERVKIGYGQGEVEKVAGNRRVKLSDGSVITGWGDGPTPPPGLRIVGRGPVEKNIGLVVFRNMKNRPVGAIVNYNSHIHLYPILYFTSELAGYVAKLIDKKIPGIVTVYTNGAEGNTSLCPNIRAFPNDMTKWNAVYKHEVTRLSRIMADKILKISKQIKYENKVRMEIAETVLKIRSGRSREAIERISVVAINGLALVGEVEEMFVEYALELNKKSPFRSTFVVGMNGVRNFYFPTDHAIEEGGYEAGLFLEPKSMERTIAASVKLLKKTYKRIKR